MHETSIVRALLEQVDTQARSHRASAVRKVTVRLGELCGVEAQLLATAFETFRERTVADGAELTIETVPALWTCPQCGREFRRGELLQCAGCGVPVRMIAGDEIVLARLEMEVA